MYITEMKEEYVSEIALIEKLCFSSPWSEQALKEELTNQNAVFLTALENGKVVGYMGFHYVLDEGYVANVAVHPDFRKKGIGKALVNEAQNKACELSLSFLSLEVRKSNHIAQKLYLGLGYKNQGIRPNFYTNPVEDAYIMTKFFGEEEQ